MNVLTFDIEEWFLQKKYFGNHAEKYAEYDYYLDLLLEALDKRRVKATFFCVGGMAAEFPQVVSKIERQGHEIGCHSFNHTWLNKMTQEEVKEDTRKAIDSLEQCIGKKIKSYRAPAFSIGENNKWVFCILSKCGIVRDASIFPAERDFGGFPKFGEKKPSIVFFDRSTVKEFPVCTTTIFGHEIAYSGGGYFRFFPMSFVKREMQRSNYTMTYFHISDLIPETTGMKCREEFERYYKVPGTLKNRYIRYVKSNFGKKKAFGKLLDLLSTKDFVSLEQADSMINWEEMDSIIL